MLEICSYAVFNRKERVMINFKRINKTMLYKLVKEFAGISDLPKMKDCEFDFYPRTVGKRGRSRNCYLLFYQDGVPCYINYFCYETYVHFFVTKFAERDEYIEIALDMDWLTENGYIEFDEVEKAKLQNEPESIEIMQSESELESSPTDEPTAETGIFVLDMPKTCADCAYSHGYFCSANIDIHSLAMHPARNMIPFSLFDTGRPDWCPVRVVPDNQDICSNSLSNVELSYRLGWNTCRDAVIYGLTPIRNG